MSGPFIVRHRVECWECEGSGTLCPPEPTMLDRVQPCGCDGGWRVLSVEAVGHHAEALIACFKLVGEGDSPEQGAARKSLTELPDEGGRVELPDGSVVGVEATSWYRLASEVEIVPGDHPPNERERAAILAIWNVRHGIPAGDERSGANG